MRLRLNSHGDAACFWLLCWDQRLLQRESQPCQEAEVTELLDPSKWRHPEDRQLGQREMKIETHICPVGARVPYEAEAALELILRPSLPVMMSPSFRAYTPAPHLDLPDLAQCPAPGPSTQKHSLKPSCEPGQHLRQSCKEHRDWKL